MGDLWSSGTSRPRNRKALDRSRETMTRKEIEKQMGELARQYTETRDPKIKEAISILGRELERMEKLEKQ